MICHIREQLETLETYIIWWLKFKAQAYLTMLSVMMWYKKNVDLKMCIHLRCMRTCVRDFHSSHTLVNHHRTVVTQRMKHKHVWFQFYCESFANGCDWFLDHPLVKQFCAGRITLKNFMVLSARHVMYWQRQWFFNSNQKIRKSFVIFTKQRAQDIQN